MVDFACILLAHQGIRSKQRFTKVAKRVEQSQTEFQYPTPVPGGGTTSDGSTLI